MNIFFKNTIRKFKRFSEIIKSEFSQNGRELRKISKIKRYSRFKTDIFGFPFFVIDSRSFIGQYKEIFNKEIYYFEANTSHPFIIDCGSNIGVSLLYFIKKYPNCEILGFEADPSLFKILMKNLEKFNNGRIKVFNKAVWDKNEKVVFSSEGADAGRLEGLSQADMNNSKFEVNSISLKEYLNRNVALLKLDIEGAEVAVLKDIENNLELVHRIFIEFHSFSNKNQRLSEILRILEKNGFRYFIQQTSIDNEMPFHKRKTVYGIDNLLNIFAYKSL